MENTKTTNFTKGTIQKQLSDGTGHIPSCPFWIFGNDKSADADIKDKFDIIDDKTKN